VPHTIPGLHHVTAICGPPQDNVDFFTGPMRQRLVKRTVNFDDPDTYHLYYGDPDGSPGTILTFFPFENAVAGRVGPGMASAVAYAVPPGGLGAWMDRLAGAAIDFDGPHERFGAAMIRLADPDGLPVELVEADGADDVRAFHSVTLWLADPEPTARLLGDIFGFGEAGSEREPGGERLRLRAAGAGQAAIVDLMRRDARTLPRPGRGTIHHVAFRAETDAIQREWRERLLAAGYNVTPVIDRQYFNAIYFREPGGVLFEIATDPPGFCVDEPKESLGRDLKLPARYEPRREGIERRLPRLVVRA